jgi:hypothetical protein
MRATIVEEDRQGDQAEVGRSHAKSRLRLLRRGVRRVDPDSDRTAHLAVFDTFRDYAGGKRLGRLLARRARGRVEERIEVN